MTRYYRLSGGGNDFLALAGTEAEPSPRRVRAWCSRGVSAGADGVFLLRREEDGAARMIHFNADGGRAALCVNGVRCAARLASHLGWATDRLTIRTDAGEIEAWLGDGETATVAPPPPPPPRRVTVDGGGRDGWSITIGVPHLVLEWPQTLAAAPVAELGPRLRRDPALGPAGANVDFVRFARPDRVELRTYERGVEAETLACGSGVLAAVAVGVAQGSLGSSVEAISRGGFRFQVASRLDDGRSISAWTLTGDARLVAEGSLLPGAERVPAPPEWS